MHARSYTNRKNVIGILANGLCQSIAFVLGSHTEPSTPQTERWLEEMWFIVGKMATTNALRAIIQNSIDGNQHHFTVFWKNAS